MHRARQFLQDNEIIGHLGKWEQPNPDLMRWHGGGNVLVALNAKSVTLASEARYDSNGLYCGRHLELKIGDERQPHEVAVAFADRLRHQSKWIQ